jgi:hypothetical protein
MRLIITRGLVVLLIALLVPITVLGEEYLAGGVTITLVGFNAESEAWLEYGWILPTLYGQLVGDFHRLNDGTDARYVERTVSHNGPNGSEWRGQLSLSTAYSHCYQGRVDGRGLYGTTNSYHSAVQCADPPPRPPTGTLTTCCAEDGSSTICSPIVVNLSSSVYRLSGQGDTVDFDLDGDGLQDRTTWTAEGSDVSFLALDLNRNGRIDSGRELFGTGTLLRSGTSAPNGFAALAQLDDNADGVVDSADRVWFDLLLWTDIDHDGRTDANELRPVIETTLRGIETEYTWTGRADAHGNLFSYLGHLRSDQGRRVFYDVILQKVP